MSHKITIAFRGFFLSWLTTIYAVFTETGEEEKVVYGVAKEGRNKVEKSGHVSDLCAMSVHCVKEK